MVASQDADPGENDLESSSDSSGEMNPFAPVAVPTGGTITRPASGLFWIFLVVLLAASTALIFAIPFWGVALLAATIMSGIRVPLLQRQFAQRKSRFADEPTSSTLLLFTSMLLNLAMGGASVVTFVVICLPAGFLSFSLFDSSVEGSIMTIVFGGSALIALVVYFVLFRLSLRLNA